MKAMKNDKDRELPEYLQTINETFEASRDQIDYAYEEFHRKVEEQEAEGDYEFEDYEVNADGDEEYEFFGFNNKVDRDFAEEVKSNFRYKPAEGVKMVEYDRFGLPINEQMTKMKKELNLRDEDVLRDDGTQVLFIKPPEEYRVYGYHRNVDVERKDMNQEMKDVFDVMEEKEVQVLEDECIDDDFLHMLNDNQPAMVEREEEYKVEAVGPNDFKELAEDEEEAMQRAREEADAMLVDMPPGLSDDMQMRLAGAREFLSNKNKKETEPVNQEEIDNDFQDILGEYNDDDIGAVQDDMMDQFEDMIDQDAFNEIMQDFIETNKES